MVQRLRALSALADSVPRTNIVSHNHLSVTLDTRETWRPVLDSMALTMAQTNTQTQNFLIE